MSDTPITDALMDDESTSKFEWARSNFRLERKLAQAEATLAEIKQVAERIIALYEDLLYCVGNKYPNESRHETAKRYLLRAESQNIPCQTAIAKSEP